MKNYYEQTQMEEINKQLSVCKKCLNRNTRGGNFLSANEDKADVIFIAQNPGMSWYDKKILPHEITPFALDDDSNDYHFFFDVFRRIFFRWFNREPIFYVTNIVKCVTKNNELKDQEMIRTCIENYLWDELEFFSDKNTKLIVLGSPAKNALSGKLGYDFYFAKHPGWLNRQGKKFTVKYTMDIMREVYEREKKN